MSRKVTMWDEVGAMTYEDIIRLKAQFEVERSPEDAHRMQARLEDKVRNFTDRYGRKVGIVTAPSPLWALIWRSFSFAAVLELEDPELTPFGSTLILAYKQTNRGYHQYVLGHPCGPEDGHVITSVEYYSIVDILPRLLGLQRVEVGGSDQPHQIIQHLGLSGLAYKPKSIRARFGGCGWFNLI